MPETTNVRLVTTYTIVHGTAEFLTALTLFSWLGSWDSPGVLIPVYSVLAFGFPLVVAILGLGILHGVSEGRLGLAGTVLIAAGMLAGQYGWVCVVLLGVGSALFHIAAGTATLKQSRPGTSVGVFESVGAVGLASGTVLGSFQVVTPWIYAGLGVILLGGLAVLLWGTPVLGVRGVNRGVSVSNTPIDAPLGSSGARIGVLKRFSPRFAPRTPSSGAGLAGLDYQQSTPYTVRRWTLAGSGWLPVAALLGLALVSVIRALVGFTAPQPWKVDSAYVLVAAIFVMLGRGLGGIIADRIGFVVPAIVGFLGAAVLLTMWPNSAAAGLLGVFFLALPMAPVILALLRSTARPAVSFGLAQFLQVPAAVAAGILWEPWVVFVTLIICAIIMAVLKPLDGRKNVTA